MRLTRELMFLALGGMVACSSYPTVKSVPLDCTVDSAYQFDPFDRTDPNFDAVGLNPMSLLYNAGDTPGFLSNGVEAMPDGDRCGSTAALVMRSAHNNDWGSIFVFFFGVRDAGPYEGISFWARAPGATTKGFTMQLDDINTANPTEPTNGVDPNPNDSNCQSTMTADGGQSQTCFDSMSMQYVPCGTTTAPAPNACGNSYAHTQVVTTDWRFYTVPFREFQQSHMPNEVPNSILKTTGSTPGTNLLTDHLVRVVLRMQREATMELWMDNLSFYRMKGAGTGGDGGVDAR